MTAAEHAVCNRDIESARRAVDQALRSVAGIRDAERFAELAAAALADCATCFRLHHQEPTAPVRSIMDKDDCGTCGGSGCPECCPGLAEEEYGEPVGDGGCVHFELRPEPAKAG